MYYFDTSVVAPLILPEKHSKHIEDFMRDVPAGSLAVSHWVRVEFASLLARRVRMKELGKAQALGAMNVFEQLLTRSFHVIMPTIADFDEAARLLQRFDTGLRSGDALHLVIAKNHDMEMFYTLDKVLVKAATAHRIPAKLGV